MHTKQQLHVCRQRVSVRGEVDVEHFEVVPRLGLEPRTN